VGARVRRWRAQKRLSQACDAVSSGPQSGQPRSEERFKEAAEAYSVLSDSAEARRLQPVRPSGRADGFRQRRIQTRQDFQDLSGYFERRVRVRRRVRCAARSQQQKRTRAQRGDDVRYDLEIGFEDSIAAACRLIFRSRGWRPALDATARARSRKTVWSRGTMCRGRGDGDLSAGLPFSAADLSQWRRPRPDYPPVHARSAAARGYLRSERS